MISAGSIMRPEPVMPEARRPTAGPATVMPRDLSVATLCCVAGLSYMWPSMAGQTTTGARVASTVVVRASSASPWAMRAMVLAVAGATTTRSARSAMATWSIRSSVLGSNMSVTIGRWVMLPKASGDAKRVAALGHDDIDRCAVLGQLAGEVHGLVAGDAARDSQRYGLAL